MLKDDAAKPENMIGEVNTTPEPEGASAIVTERSATILGIEVSATRELLGTTSELGVETATFETAGKAATSGTTSVKHVIKILNHYRHPTK